MQTPFKVPAFSSLSIVLSFFDSFSHKKGGTTWINIPSTIKADFYYVNKLFTSPSATGTLYAGTSTGVFRSRDSGNTWSALFRYYSPLNCPKIYSGNILEMDVSSLGTTDLILAWKSRYGLYRSTDSGDTWTAVIQSVAAPDDVYHRGAIAISKSNNNYVSDILNCRNRFFKGLY